MDLKTEFIKAEGVRVQGERRNEPAENAGKKIKWRKIGVVFSCHIEYKIGVYLFSQADGFTSCSMLYCKLEVLPNTVR